MKTMKLLLTLLFFITSTVIVAQISTNSTIQQPTNIYGNDNNTRYRSVYDRQERQPQYKQPTYQKSNDEYFTVEDEFSNGYREGYIEGYNIDRGYNIIPVVPVTPVPKTLDHSYRAGYNRGIIDGKKAQDSEKY